MEMYSKKCSCVFFVTFNPLWIGHGDDNCENNPRCSGKEKQEFKELLITGKLEDNPLYYKCKDMGKKTVYVGND